MAGTTYWPTNPQFYPFGNTSPVNVAEHVPWNQKADILLLGCGDPRNIFFTLQACGADKPSNTRKMDFTCCDIEPGIIARNILLLTLIVDDLFHERRHLLWHIFYDVFLDQECLSLLAQQCTHLASLSTSMTAWRTSQYSEFIRFASISTLQQARRYWQWYAKADGPTDLFMDSLKANALENMRYIMHPRPDVLASTACRSAGPMWQPTILTSHEAHCQWWETGLTSSDPDRIKTATHLNPTFACASLRPGFSCDTSIAPLSTFHLSPACNPLEPPSQHPLKLNPEPEDLYREAKAQFQSWMDVFRACVPFTGRIVIRFVACDCLSLCPTLEEYGKSGRLSVDLRLHPYTIAHFALDRDEYTPSLRWKAPYLFDVIDTSTLNDDIGMLNCFITALPLLKRTPWATFYTETRLQTGHKDPTRGITTSLCNELSSTAMLFDIVPLSYVSGFNTLSNIHENLFHHVFRTTLVYFERLGWKRPSQLTRPGQDFVVSFQPHQLGTLLYNIYTGMFRYESLKKILKPWPEPGQVLLRDLCKVPYTRRSFVLLLRLLQRRISTDWESVLDTVFEKTAAALDAPISLYYLDELDCQMRLLGLYTSPDMEDDDEERYYDKAAGPFRDWATIPPVVCVVLTVPRADLDKLEGPRLPFNPRITAEINDSEELYNFACLETTFGTLRMEGSGEHAIPVVDEDAYGRGGGSPWIVSFLTPAVRFARNPENTSVGLAVMNTVENSMFDSVLDTKKLFFTASLSDTAHVRVFAQRLTSSEEHPIPIAYAPSLGPVTPPELQFTNVRVALDEDEGKTEHCKEVKTFTLRTVVDDDVGKAILASDATGVKVEQITHCEMMLTMGTDWLRKLQFPFSINGSTSKLRIARSSGWIEVIVEMGTFERCSLSLNRFPVIRHQGVILPWNAHLLMPGRCPQLSLDQPHLLKWVGLHLRFAYSDKEQHALGHQRNQSTITQLKKALYTIFTSLANYRDKALQHNVFALQRARGGLDSLILVPAVRLDLAAHTLFADAYLLPTRRYSGSNDVNSLSGWRDLLASACTITLSDNALEMWKYMVPAMAERCRDWRHKIRCVYRDAGRIPLSTKFQESPLCECGEGRTDEGFTKHETWAPFAPYVTRIALSPLFAVTFLESVGADHDEVAERLEISASSLMALTETNRRGELRGPNLQLKPTSIPSPSPSPPSGNGSSTGTTPTPTPTTAGNECHTCGKIIPDGTVKVCSRCKMVKYCSRDCQVDDWKTHKPYCSPKN